MPNTRARSTTGYLGAGSMRTQVGRNLGAGIAATIQRIAAAARPAARSVNLGRVGSHFSQDFNDLPSGTPASASFIAESDSLATVQVSSSKTQVAPDSSTAAIYDADDDPYPGPGQAGVVGGRLYAEVKQWIPGGVEVPVKFAWSNPAEGIPDPLNFTLDVTLVPL